MIRISLRTAVLPLALALVPACRREPDTESILRAGHALLESGHPERALASFRTAATRARSASDDWIEATLGEAEALVLLERLGEARRRLDDLERSAPPSPDLERRVRAIRARASERPAFLTPTGDVIDEETIPLRDLIDRAVDSPIRDASDR